MRVVETTPRGVASSGRICGFGCGVCDIGMYCQLWALGHTGGRQGGRCGGLVRLPSAIGSACFVAVGWLRRLVVCSCRLRWW